MRASEEAPILVPGDDRKDLVVADHDEPETRDTVECTPQARGWATRHWLRTEERVVLAWVACAVAIAAGGLGLVLLATNAPSARTSAVPARRVRYSVPQWVAQTEVSALDALAIVRRLAVGVSPREVTALQVSLHDVAQRFVTLRASIPARLVGTSEGDALARMLRDAADGARAEAAQLSGVTLMRTDRRAFLNALRGLRDASERFERTVAASAATGDVAPSFTVA
jgi:hypothetical protein